MQHLNSIPSVIPFSNVNYYVLSTAKGIVKDREVKDGQASGAYRPGEVTNPRRPHCIGHTQPLGKTVEKRQEAAGAESLHVAQWGLSSGTGKWHNLPGLGKSGAKTLKGK